MRKREKIPLPALGGCSLLVIFAVLCLVVFSLLSVNTVLAERRLSEASIRKTEAWYAADLKAQEVFARLRNGETVPGVIHQDGEYAYSVPISEHQTLLVILQESDGCWEVLSWRAKAHPEDGTTTLPVWQGTEGEK